VIFNDDEGLTVNMTDQTQLLALYVKVGINVLSARLVLLLALALTFGLFAWAVVDPTWPRITAAALFAVLVFFPATRVDAAQSRDRAVITPKE
jgi:membrane protein YdbS with pleckstrin-like domain